MLEQIMYWAILGHFIGDYLAQPKEMAINKSGRGWMGAAWCAAHCLFYTGMVILTVAAGTGTLLERQPGALIVAGMVFLSHYPIDRWSLADKWLKLIKGRTLQDLYGKAYELQVPHVAEYNTVLISTEQAFAALVYAVVDNTMHIILMTAGFAVLLHWGVI